MFSASVQHMQDSSIGYRVEHRNNCILVFGSVPIRAFVKINKLAPKNSIISPRLAELAECNLAMGLPKDIDKLSKQLEPQALQRVAAAHSELSHEAIKWLAIGEHGSSSKCMFYYFTGIKQNADFDDKAYPHDPSDFRRCRLLLEQVPEFKPKLSKMAGVSDIWKSLIDSWEVLCDTMDSESPTWKIKQGSAPNTYSLIQAITNKSKVINFTASHQDNNSIKKE